MTAGDRSRNDGGCTADQLRVLEESLLDAAVRRDGKKLRSMLAEDFLEFASSGRVWNRDGLIEFLARETGFSAPAIEDFRCALLADSVALVTYRAAGTDPNSGGLLASLRSSIWTSESGAWRMRFHQGTCTAAEGPLRRG